MVCYRPGSLPAGADSPLTSSSHFRPIMTFPRHFNSNMHGLMGLVVILKYVFFFFCSVWEGWQSTCGAICSEVRKRWVEKTLWNVWEVLSYYPCYWISQAATIWSLQYDFGVIWAGEECPWQNSHKIWCPLLSKRLHVKNRLQWWDTTCYI